MRTALVLLLLAGLAAPQERRPASRTPLQITVKRDVEYARAGDTPLLLDLYLPAGAQARASLPLVIWIHGGGWRAGSKARCPALFLAERGYAVASIDYRLVPRAHFPAQIHDCKAAVRWLRAHADEYGLDPNRFGAWGSSAGGHLAALLGTSGGVEELDGELGHRDLSSRVQAVISFCGPSDFLHWKRRQRGGRSPEFQLLGGRLDDDQVKRRAESASPVTHASPDDPPFLIVHGTRDRIVPVEQAKLLHEALRKQGVNAYLELIEGAGHGLFSDRTRLLAALFFDLHLKQKGKQERKRTPATPGSSRSPRREPLPAR